MTGPLTRAIVVNHDGGELVERCVDSLLADGPAPDRLHVVVVDNASTDGSPERLASRPGVTVVRAGANLGFGAGVDRGRAAPGPEPDQLLLLNPDAWIEPDALARMSAVLAEDPSVGAVCPRIVFDQLFTRLLVTSSVPTVLHRAQSGTLETTPWVHVVAGGDRRLDRRGTPRWHLDRHSVVLVPHHEHIELDLVAENTRGTVHVDWDGGQIERPVDAHHTGLAVSGAPGRVHVQNEGSFVRSDGTGVNRHFHRPVDQLDDEPVEVFAWCGAAALLRQRMLTDIGSFAAPYFLYYEDTDLAWRGRAAGWRHVTEPDAVVHHRHSAFTGQGRTLTEVLQHRNRVLTMVRNAPAGSAARAALGLVLTAGSTSVNGVRHRHGTGRAAARWRAVAGVVRHAPWALAERRRLGASATRDRREVFADAAAVWPV